MLCADLAHQRIAELRALLYLLEKPTTIVFYNRATDKPKFELLVTDIIYGHRPMSELRKLLGIWTMEDLRTEAKARGIDIHNCKTKIEVEEKLS